MHYKMYNPFYNLVTIEQLCLTILCYDLGIKNMEV